MKIAARRDESFLLGVQHECKVKTQDRRESRRHLVAVEAYCYYNSGAYGDTTPNLITRGYAATGPYRVPQLYDGFLRRVHQHSRPPRRFAVTASPKWLGLMRRRWTSSPMRLEYGSARDQAQEHFAKRRSIFHRRADARNALQRAASTAAAEKIGWQRRSVWCVREGNKIRAKGIGVIVKGMATPTTSTATVKLNADGSLNVLTSSVEMGQGLKTALAQIAASEAGLPVSRVRVSEPDTAFTPFDLMTAASRATFCMGTAIRRGDAAGYQRAAFGSGGGSMLEAAKED